jgi:hypothetical protein
VADFFFNAMAFPHMSAEKRESLTPDQRKNHMNGKLYGKKRLRTVIPPWLIIGAVVILVPVFIFMTAENINRLKGQTTHLPIIEL